MYVQINII